MSAPIRLLLSAYKAQQTWRSLPPEERRRIVAAARTAMQQGPRVGADGTPLPPQTGAARAGTVVRAAAEVARQQGPVVANRALQRAAGRAGLAGRVAGAIIRSRAGRPS
jgi:hypothetical protein